MYQIVSKEQFSQNVFRLCVKAPLIARACRAGNFVIVRIAEKGERIPLTIAASDADIAEWRVDFFDGMTDAEKTAELAKEIKAILADKLIECFKLFFC